MGAHTPDIEEMFSGQGVVLVGVRNNSNGRPKGLRAVGNCPALSIKNATSVLEHKESMTGARGTNKRLTTEIKVTLSATFEDFQSKNLADAIRGAVQELVGATVTDSPVSIYHGLINPLDHVKVSGFALKMGATNTLTAYVNDTTSWDYKLNTEAGSYKLNDGSEQAMANLGLVPTALTVGASTVITVPSGHGVLVGDTVVGRGFTGAQAGDINDVPMTVTAVTSTTVTTSPNTTGDTITVAAGTRLVNKTNAMPATVTYTYVTQQHVKAFTEGAKELFLRFEGLNTAEDNIPVVVEVFKFLLDPTQELALISDGLQSFVLEGSVLADASQSSDSKYYTVKKIDKT